MTEKRATYRTRRSRSRIDKNQPVIVAALEAVGCRVIDTSSLGSGYPDLTVIRPDGSVVLVEIKAPDGAEIKPREMDMMIFLVSASYRIFTTPEQAAANITAWS